MHTNVPFKTPPVFTHEGAKARSLSPLQELRRSALSALLFEKSFYESGQDHADRVASLVSVCAPADVSALAIECRNRMYLRHMPLFLARELARRKGLGSYVAAILEDVIQRPDELAEYLAIYWKNGRQPVSAGSKRGLARAFRKFDAQTLSKYNRNGAVKLRDVLRIVHAEPGSAEQAAVWKALIKDELPTADTWEVALSSGADKKETFERLLREKKLGGLAFLRNLRNMIQAKVDTSLIEERFNGGFGKILPFRFVAALQHAPQFVRGLDYAMQKCLQELPMLPGTTGVLVDVSGSMESSLSSKSDMTRMDVAAGLAVLVSGLAERARIFTFSHVVVEVPPFGSLALVNTILESQAHGGTYLSEAVNAVNQEKLDRLIVITDEQSGSRRPLPNPTARGYMINVAAYQNGVGYGPWVHIDGWSERVLDFIVEYEQTL